MIWACVHVCACTVHMVCYLSMFENMLECVQCAEVRGWWPNPLDAQNSSAEGQCIFPSLFLYQALVLGYASRMVARWDWPFSFHYVSVARALSLIHTLLHAFGFLNIIHRITLVLKLTVASSHGICGVRTKWRKKSTASACTSKSHQAFAAFLPKNFSTLVIVRRYSFPFFLFWHFLSLLIFFSLRFSLLFPYLLMEIKF